MAKGLNGWKRLITKGLATFVVRTAREKRPCAVLLGAATLVRLERELTEAPGRRVDLLTEAAISPHLRDQILREQREIYEATN